MALALPIADVVEITQTLARYGHVVDNGDVDALDQVFTDDAEMYPAHPGMAPIAGLAALRATIASIPQPNHNTLPPTISVDADGTVRAVSRYLQLRPDGGVVNGEYLDVVVPTAAGWRVSSRRVLRRYPPMDEGGPGRATYGPFWPSAPGSAPS
jgi:ketosteroid isomerase-like protein